MNKKIIKLLIFVKAIDGGTGTYVLNIKEIKKLFPASRLRIKIVVLEKPSHRIIKKQNGAWSFLRKSQFYNQRYTFSLRNVFSFIEELLWFKGNLSEFKPNVVISVDLHCNLIASIIRTLYQKKHLLILTTHINVDNNIEQRTDYLLKSFLRKLISYFYNKADSLIFVSKQLAVDCQQRFHLNRKLINTIYNGDDNKLRQFKENRKNNVIISIARLVEQKDQKTLIKAFKLLKNRLTNVKLWIISDGHDINNLKKLVTLNKLNTKVRFFGWVKNIYSYINKSKIFVLSSKREGFGYVLIEAMSQGLPVISTDTPFGPREILDDGKYGILVPMKDPEAMAKAMYELLTDEKKYNYYAQKSLERAKYFSLDKMLSAYKKVILDLVKKS
jgi:glycosyltransferase involved in cell wall biosynthesis